MTQVPQAPPSAVPVAPAKRPGGLTAMAVLNFVFGGLGAIGCIVMLLGAMAVQAIVSGGSEMARQLGEDAAAKEVAKAAAPIMGMVWVSVLLGLVAAAMLIVSGVGYIKMSRTTGYILGHVYAIVAILNVILGLVGGLGFNFFVVIGLVYPVLTIILLNTAFKKCFPAAPAAA